MKIAILGTRGIPAQYGGFETFAEELTMRLVNKGVDATVYCDANRRKSPNMYKGVHLVHIPLPKLGSLSTILFDIRCLWHARKGFDLLYMLGYGTSLFCLIPRLWRTRVWINMDGIEWSRSKWSWYAKIWLKAMEFFATIIPDRVIADSNSIQMQLKKRHHHMVLCNIIPYGATMIKDEEIDKIILNTWELSPWNYYLVVCRLEPENHVAEIINGFLASKSIKKLLIVGDHQIKTAYVQDLKNISDEKVQFFGAIYDQVELRNLRYYAFAYFHGHSVGGTNPSLLEALGCKNPVIANDNIFNKEVAGDAALYFSRSEDIPELIELLESSPGKREDMRRHAYEIIRSRYTWESVVDRYYDLLKQDTARLPI